jgi:hypothetical protein
MLISSKIKIFKLNKRTICMPSPKTEQKILKKPPNVSRNGEEEFWVLVVPDENWVLL